jgi:hypothetical protein
MFKALVGAFACCMIFAAAGARAQMLVWNLLGPTPRDGAAMAFDSARGVTVMFGQNTGQQSGLWEWNGNVWLERIEPGPPRLGAASMVYDSARGVCVVFGGYNNQTSTYSSVTWEWNGQTWKSRSSTGPTPRAGAAMAYDAHRRVSVLFGGINFSGPCPPETWEWDGSNWTLRAHSGPPSRFSTAMAFDEDRHVCVMYGGSSISGAWLADTWEWDGIAWSERASSGPPPAFGVCTVYDAQRHRTLLYGGYTFPLPNTIVWAWDGASWAPLSAEAGAPNRIFHSMAFDSVRGTCVLFGGSDGDDTWEWNGSWTQRNAPSPSARTGFSLAYDSARRREVFFGGFHNYRGSRDFKGDTWEHDGRTWIERSAPGPSPRTGTVSVYDASRGVTVLFGGHARFGSSMSDPYTYYPETWEWNGDAWSLRTTTGPAAFPEPQMVYDSHRKVSILFGGAGSNETWEWDGAVWTFRTASGPSSRKTPTLGYDAERRVTVLYGGSRSGRYLTDTWEWNGTMWTLRSIADSVYPIALANFTFDPVRRHLLLMGGSQEAGYGDSLVWEYSGDVWSNRPYDDPYSARLGRTQFDPNFNAFFSLPGNDDAPLAAFVTAPPCAAATIFAQPANVTICAGQAARLEVSSSNTFPTTFQWCRGDPPKPIVNAQSPVLVLLSPSSDDSDIYRCIINTRCGTIISNPATLTVRCAADFDNSGGTPDITDIDAFFSTWLLGDATADSDCSGGTPDAADVEYFFTAWLAGGC